MEKYMLIEQYAFKHPNSVVHILNSVIKQRHCYEVTVLFLI
jgi:hypothetical protein